MTVSVNKPGREITQIYICVLHTLSCSDQCSSLRKHDACLPSKIDYICTGLAPGLGALFTCTQGYKSSGIAVIPTLDIVSKILNMIFTFWAYIL